MKVVGIDPGIKGALASWDGSDLIVFEIPNFKSGGRGQEVDWVSLYNSWCLFFDLVDAYYIEKVSAMPGQGVASMFKFGYIAGGLRGIAISQNKPIYEVRPSVWKLAMGVTKNKKQTVAKACQEFPSYAHMFKGPKGGLKDGLAEAALIARYGYQKQLGVR